MRLHNCLGAALSAMLFAGPAVAGTFTYDGYSVVNNTNVVINAGPTQGTFGSGQIDLIGSGPNQGQTLPTWCIDVFYDLQGQGTYSIVAPPLNNMGGDFNGTVIPSTTLAKIASLVRYGNANVNVGGTSPAVQLAIWDVEYAGYGYTFTSTNGAVNTQTAGLVTQANNATLPALPISYLREVVLVGADGHELNQGLVFATPIPGALLLFGSAVAAVGGATWFVNRREHDDKAV